MKSSRILRTIDVSPEFASHVSFIHWSPVRRPVDDEEYQHPLSSGGFNGHRKGIEQAGESSRIFLADEDTIKVWDLQNTEWSATISNAGGNIGKPSNIDFGADSDEVSVFYDFGIKLKIWFLSTGRSVEIRDPKFATKGYGYRRQSGHFALLTRPGAYDIVTLHAPKSYEIVSSFTVPSVDAQGLKWSPDGRWLGVWDSASSGFKVLVYTSDGHLYRTYKGQEEDGVSGIGVKSVEWSPMGDCLAISGYDNRVTVLGTTTVSLLND